MAYHRKDMLEEDKWNIHSSGYRQERYSSSEGKTAEYKHEHYSNKAEKDAYKSNEDYRKNDEEKEGKKNEEGSNKPSIENAVNEEIKREADEEQEIFKIAAKEISQGFHEDRKDIKTKKKHNNRSIEEAINKAIKEEKETIMVE